MSVGIYIKCDRDHCSTERAISSPTAELPVGWLQGYGKRYPYEDPEMLHFCSGTCASLHEFTVRKAEEEIEAETVAENEEAVA